ncbi:MAG: alkaline phosphatase family protein [Gloeobacteraceae cyanobacterium ES-bin-316]|nr:alkaline phosphatase family protein [Ferruginibacter sp.]
MITKFKASLFFLILTVFGATAQQKPIANKNLNPPVACPKLVVGLVIDQMRWDYLYRYQNLYSSGGFKRLLSQGYSFENTMVPFTPTYTAPGHTGIYTGSVPAIHGIVGNNWFDKNTNRSVYCTDDSTVTSVGSTTVAGKMSPVNMWANTITDELRLSTNFKSKVIGISLKDRGAILPAGHSGNAAYWYDDAVGKFITSSYYMKALPAWVDKFNVQDLPAAYMTKDWNTLYPLDKYVLSSADNMAYEIPLSGETAPVFPHKVSSIVNGKYAAFKYTPYANTYSFDFAKAVIENEQLGASTATDFLTLSISSTDYIGHSFGPNSIEMEDTYYRLDRDIATFLSYMDAKLGKGNYLVFLSADHGVAHIPAFLKQHNMPGGYFDEGPVIRELNASLASEFGVNNIIQSSMNYQLYLNTNEVEKNGKDLAAIKKIIIKKLKAQPYIVNAFETEKIYETTLEHTQQTMMANGYNPARSGDIMFTVKPGYFDGSGRGTTHGLWNPYDAHIPNVWFGWNIRPGKSNRETYMTDIAPTLAALLKIQMPNGSVGKVLEEIVK